MSNWSTSNPDRWDSPPLSPVISDPLEQDLERVEHAREMVSQELAELERVAEWECCQDEHDREYD